MCSVPDADPDSDLTAVARIRLAAIACVAREGGRASLRLIAAEAGVSAALILHHFGSKAGLLDACDAWVLDRVGVKASGGVGAAAAIDELSGAPLDYLARLLVEGGPRADAVVDAFAGTARGRVASATDPEASAIVLVAMGLAPVLLRGQILRTLGNRGLERFARAQAALVHREPPTEERP